MRATDADGGTATRRRLLDAVVHSSPAGMLVCDAAGALVTANAAAERLLGLALGDATGVPLRRLVDERLKWRFTNPADTAAAVRDLMARSDPARALDAETVDGRALRLRCAPVRAQDGGEALGSLVTIADVSEARDALERARRLADERARLLQAEELRAHEEASLAAAAQLLGSALTPADVDLHLLRLAPRLVPACEKTAVLVADRRGVVRVAAHDGFHPDTVARMVFRPDEGVVGRVIAGGRPFICNDTAADPRGTSRITGPEGIRSFMHVPIVVGDRVHGIIVVNSARPRAFGERELRIVTELARLAAGALQNALRFVQERHIADTLQRALAAGAPPHVEGLHIAMRHRAAAGVRVGGDICTAWSIPGGGGALLIGDVSGRGIEAAGIAVMVRHMAEALGRHHRAPGELAGELNDLLHARLPDGSLVTLALVVVAPGGGDVLWTNAGHPAPVLLARGGEITTLADPGPPCGAFPGRRYPTRRAAFAPGDLLVLYTDGLTEARRGGRELGEQALHGILAAHAHLPADELPGAVVRAVEEWCDAGLDDDVAIAAVRRSGGG